MTQQTHRPTIAISKSTTCRKASSTLSVGLKFLSLFTARRLGTCLRRLSCCWKPQTDESKRYDYEYTDTLIYGADSSSSLSGIIYGAGHIPGALVVKYFGAITNPRVRITGEISGKTYGVCRLTTTLSESDILMISTRYENSFVRRVSAGGAETDLLDALDLSATPFFHIPVDEPCTVSIEADSAITGE